jgi:hypothetical protein
MVTSITRTRSDVSTDEIGDAICNTFNLHPVDFAVHFHQPGDFLFIFSSRQNKNSLMVQAHVEAWHLLTT